MNLLHKSTEVPEDWMGPFLISVEEGKISEEGIYQWDDHNRIFYRNSGDGWLAVRLEDTKYWVPFPAVEEQVFDEIHLGFSNDDN